MQSEWSDFQKYVWETWWRRQFPRSKGWCIEYQKTLLDGAIVIDFAAWVGNKRAVGDAKDKAVLTMDDVEKLIEDGSAFKAAYLYLIIAADTMMPDRVQEHADNNEVEIVRTRWRA
jgi:hypothetical protein